MMCNWDTNERRLSIPTATQLFLYRKKYCKIFLWNIMIRTEAQVCRRGLNVHLDTMVVLQLVSYQNRPLYDTLIVAIYPYITRLDKVLNVLMLQNVLNNYIKFPIILSNSVDVFFNISILHNDIFTITCTIETQFLMIWHPRKSWWNFITTRHDKFYIYVILSMLHLYIL